MTGGNPYLLLWDDLTHREVEEIADRLSKDEAHPGNHRVDAELLLDEVRRLGSRLALLRDDHDQLLASVRAAVKASKDGDPDSLEYLRMHLDLRDAPVGYTLTGRAVEYLRRARRAGR